MNIRLKFTKGNEVKYISHLDLMRVFQRAIRRTGIPIAYSSGFNPHQEISFGAPLSLGVTSNAEYIDLKLAESMDVQEVKERLNSSMPDGIRILEGIKLKDSHKSAMSVVTHARYRISMNIEDVTFQKLRNSIEAFTIQEHIKVMKEQPKKNFALKEIDIKPMIVNMNLAEIEGNSIVIECLLLSGSRGNLKPELLIVAFEEYTGYKITGIRINREEVYAEKAGRLVDLLEYEG
jgi:radical SAM-linked protein